MWKVHKGDGLCKSGQIWFFVQVYKLFLLLIVLQRSGSVGCSVFCQSRHISGLCLLLHPQTQLRHEWDHAVSRAWNWRVDGQRWNRDMVGLRSQSIRRGSGKVWKKFRSDKRTSAALENFEYCHRVSYRTLITFVLCFMALHFSYFLNIFVCQNPLWL